MSAAPDTPLHVTLDDLVRDLRAAGLRAGMICLVHSSLSKIGQVDGGADTVVRALVEAVGDSGTVLFPALTFSGSVTLFLREHPVVDLRTNPIPTGAIPRAAARHPRARRSIHPTHTVIAIGPAAAEIFAGQQSGQGPCGTQSPFYRSAVMGGRIVLIGVTNASNTTLHTVEELGAPYIYPGDVFNVRTIDYDGREHTITVRGYPTRMVRDFNVINDQLLRQGIMTEHKLGMADLRVIDARRMIETVAARLADEPYLLGHPQQDAGT